MAKKNAKKRDENTIAVNILSQATQELKPPVDPAVSAAAKALSKLGASLGGKARAKKLSTSERKSIAKKAALARWKGHDKS